jgi:hypothetical protein
MGEGGDGGAKAGGAKAGGAKAGGAKAGGAKAGGMLGGGVHGDGVSGVAWLEREERKNSLSSSGFRRSSTSLRLFLTRLAGGDATSGSDGDSSDAGAFSQDGASVTGDDGCGRD